MDIGNQKMILFSFFILVVVLVAIIYRERARIKKVFIKGRYFEAGIELKIKPEAFQQPVSNPIPTHFIFCTKEGKDKFAASIIQIGGGGSHLYTKQVWSREEHAYLDSGLIEVSFHHTGDRMEIYCPTDYKIDSCESYTGNDILADITTPNHCGISLADQLRNEIIVNCSKKDIDNYTIPN